MLEMGNLGKIFGGKNNPVYDLKINLNITDPVNLLKISSLVTYF